KNIPFIQELFNKLNKDKYVLIRIGEKIPNIENQIAFKSISDIQKLNIIQNSDLCISPSIDEGFNMPIAECILNNIPVIASNIPVINEIYENSIITLNAKIYKYKYNDIILFNSNELNNWINTIENGLWKYDTYPAKNILLKKINQSKNNLINILNNDQKIN
ncbi:MAG: glycosyltransferase, partial [Caldisphaera sp.]